ncbi:dihydrodipicolinate synthase family protein [Kaistia dalseonensis]|uniref:4-hydroxy-tetrahydrodipicolinate synthase n=1 Tax=Kaistia dalseonensis TaxID=410840 RepID=A0ABU0HAL8_9HYPH|nr:dihydrodipicolinate synthase family protein [Kaistia dalseonensis]MCX5495951.1 dihydrodipicolinate synthase family protein [Kaistia dalseonensis]MDQ0438554.1 4-hydroxy-tetrahydrodipicolinate synthase [Kaistia dalseonensis]
MDPRATWKGVFPAVTTQFRPDYSVDLDATKGVIEALVRDGVSGLVICGTVGENCSLRREEKISLIEVAVSVAKGKVPIISGLAEYTSAFGAEYAKEATKAGVDGLMVMPAMVYPAKPRETLDHFTTIAKATDTPIMIYNNPPSYRTDVNPAMLAGLADIDTIVAFKDSSGDTRRIVDVRNMTGDRFIPFCGLDDVVLESVALGCVGWVSGMSNVFPREGETLFRLIRDRRFDEAMAIYDWFMPILHLDARSDLVQAIKYCEKYIGRGTDLTRAPRLGLDDAEKAELDAVMKKALATRTVLPEVGLPLAA